VRCLPVLLLAACSNPSPLTTQKGTTADLAIRDVRVFDGERVLEHHSVLVTDGRITALDRAAVLETQRAKHEVDGKGMTVLPGFIDSHTHVMDEADLQTALQLGVTTEVDMMSIPETSVKLARDEKATGRARVVPAGYAATAPGGHGTEYGIPVPTLTKPDEAKAYVASRIKEGSHHLKIIIDNGAAYGVKLPTLDAPTTKALTEAAHENKLLAVAHVGGADDVATALAAKVDGLVHVPLAKLDAATLDAIASGHMFVVPTLSVLASGCGRKPGVALTSDSRLAPRLTAATRENLGASFPFQIDRTACDQPAAIVGALRARHVSILAGSDAPNPGTAHGASMHGELELLVAAGLTPSEALAAATSVPARSFALADLGVIRVGAIADLLLVRGDPTTDIKATRAIENVWRAGQ
jgi:imidazolonepropionase-like amidohydrolase